MLLSHYPTYYNNTHTYRSRQTLLMSPNVACQKQQMFIERHIIAFIKNHLQHIYGANPNKPKLLPSPRYHHLICNLM